LLQLIEQQQLDITKIALAQVTDQYLTYVRAMENQNIQGIADFLVIAAKLILIKSEAILPRPPQRASGEEDPGDELARQLFEYKRFKEIASTLHQREEEGIKTFLRVAAPPKAEPKLDLSNVSVTDLWEAVSRALALLPPDTPAVATVVVPPRITIRQKIRHIQLRLRAEKHAKFFDLLKDAKTRAEVLVTFLALLELVKQLRVSVVQEKVFGDIEIESVGEWIDDDSIQIYSEMEPHEDETTATEDSGLS
jgi:segregation and condensation protein A